MRYIFKISTIVIFLTVFAVILLLLPFGSAPNVIGTNYRNVTVWTYVNITNSRPEVTGISIYDADNASLPNITVTAGGVKSVVCNASVRDWNGFNDIVSANATLYYSLNQSNDSDDNNTHYTNSSCVLNYSIDAYSGIYSCAFVVYYYANNGTWKCNVTVKDSYSNPNSSGTGGNTTYFYPVYALNVTDGINYGNVAVEEYSDNRTANLSNLGNTAINISVEGYGINRSDGLAMNCTHGNISVANERFSANATTDFGSKIALSSSSSVIAGLKILKQTTNTLAINVTYWQLYVPPNPAGNCTGFIIFSAGAP